MLRDLYNLFGDVIGAAALFVILIHGPTALAVLRAMLER